MLWSVIGSGGFKLGDRRVSLEYQALPGMGFGLAGLSSSGDEGSFWALQGLLEPRVSISYHPVNISTG